MSLRGAARLLMAEGLPHCLFKGVGIMPGRIWPNFDHERLALFLKDAIPTLLLAAAHRPRKYTSAPAEPRILVTCLAGIGDFVLLTPFLRELRRNYRNSAITLVVSRNASTLAFQCPYVDRVLTLDRGPSDPIITRPKNLAPFLNYLRYLVSFAKREFAGRIDLAIQPTWDADPEFATLLTFLSGAPRRIGYSERSSSIKRWCNFGQDHLFTDLLPAGGVKHEVERGLDIVRYLVGHVDNALPEVWPSAADQERAAAFLSKRDVSADATLVAFGIGGSQGRRHWPYYGDLIQSLYPRAGFTPVLIAGPEDRPLVHRITASAPTAVVADELSLATVACLLAKCSLFVGNDSGPMHLAAAVQCPTIEISCHPVGANPAHGNSPDRFGPVGSRKAILRPTAASEACRAGCIAEVPHCIANIKAEEVAPLALEVLRTLPSNSLSYASLT